MGPLQLTVTWYKKHLAEEQATRWDIKKQSDCIQSNLNFLCFGCPSAQLALNQGVFRTM